MLDDDDFNDELDRKSPLQRYGAPVGALVFLVAAGAVVAYVLSGGSGPAPRPHQEPRITQVQLPPPPPPPPPPKTPPPQQKETQVHPKESSTPQKAASKPAPKAPSPPAAVTTSIQGAGPGSLASGNGGGGDCIGSGCGSGDGTGGDNDAYYANIVKTQIEDALKRDEKLKFARYRMTVSFSLDAGGHVASTSVSSFTGEDDVQAEVERVLRSISTGDTPPAAIQAKQFSVRITERARG
jgi:hypothetical protein